MIELRGITKSFATKQGRHYVLNDINLNFVRGVNMGVLGLNGSGKSTLLRLISGEIFPDKGEIIRRARISWPLGFAGGFHGSLTGRENLRFISRIYGADIAKVTQFVEEFSSLGTYLENPLKTYSTGMRAKLAFGLSMAIDFDCYLIDEITAVGDMTFQKKCEATFAERRSNSTLIVVSHNPRTIIKLCDKVAIIHNKSIHIFESVQEGIKFYNYSSVEAR